MEALGQEVARISGTQQHDCQHYPNDGTILLFFHQRAFTFPGVKLPFTTPLVNVPGNTMTPQDDKGFVAQRASEGYTYLICDAEQCPIGLYALSLTDVISRKFLYPQKGGVRTTDEAICPDRHRPTSKFQALETVDN